LRRFGSISIKCNRSNSSQHQTPQPPTITSQPKFTADINSKYQYQVIATDPEQNQIIYTLVTAIAGMLIATDSEMMLRLITWKSWPNNTALVVNLVQGTNIADIGETISFQVQATE
jgi:hypothetical protein